MPDIERERRSEGKKQQVDEERRKDRKPFTHFARPIPFIIYVDVCRRARGQKRDTGRIVESKCVYSDPEIRPRFGKTASDFIFLPFVFTSVNVVCMCSPLLSRRGRRFPGIRE